MPTLPSLVMHMRGCQVVALIKSPSQVEITKLFVGVPLHGTLFPTLQSIHLSGSAAALPSPPRKPPTTPGIFVEMNTSSINTAMDDFELIISPQSTKIDKIVIFFIFHYPPFSLFPSLHLPCTFLCPGKIFIFWMTFITTFPCQDLGFFIQGISF
jgi:hypothetical protein